MVTPITSTILFKDEESMQIACDIINELINSPPSSWRIGLNSLIISAVNTQFIQTSDYSKSIEKRLIKKAKKVLLILIKMGIVNVINDTPLILEPIPPGMNIPEYLRERATKMHL